MRAKEFVDEYKVDNKKGLGATSYSSDVDYYGFRVQMKPSTFLKLATPLQAPVSVDYIEKYLQDGGALASPFLIVEIPDSYFKGVFDESPRIIGHEGRNRMMAVRKVEGDEPVEVHIITRGEEREVRARHLTPEIIHEINKGVWNQQGNTVVPGPLFTVGESINEAPIPSDWDETQLAYDYERVKKPEYRRYDSSAFDPVVNYVQQQQTKHLGRGSSRTVQNVNIDGQQTALKIAHNKFGLYQNIEEIKFLKNPTIQNLDISAKLIDYDKKNKAPVWLQTEYMNPMDERIFTQIYGLKSFSAMALYERSGYDEAKKTVETNSSLTTKQKKRLIGLFDKFKVLQSFGVGIGDLAGNNWGIDKNGVPKIVDLGYSDKSESPEELKQ